MKMIATRFIIKLFYGTTLIDIGRIFVACAFTNPLSDLTKSSTILSKDLKLENTLETSNIELEHEASQRAEDKEPVGNVEQVSVDISHPSVSIPTQSLGTAIGEEKQVKDRRENPLRNLGSSSQASSSFHRNALHSNPIPQPTFSHLHQSEGQYSHPQTTGINHNLFDSHYGSHSSLTGPFTAQPVMIPELKYTGPVVIPTIYHTYEVNYRPSHLLNDARIPAGHVSQWGLHNVPTGTWKPKNQGESRLNVESRSGKESDIDKKKDMKTQSLQAQKDMNDNMSLEEREKVNDVGEVLNEQQEHRELKTTPAIDENKNQNHVLTQLRTHNSDSSQMRSQTLKFDSENINLAKELSKLDPQETNSNNQRFSKGKTLMDNVQFSKTNGKGSADRIMHKALKDDVFISSSLSETASKSQKDNKIEHLSSSSARELSSFPDSRDIDNSKSFESISLKNKINKKITNPITRDGETVETPQPTSNYKFALLSQKVEPNKSSNFNKFSALINKPAENNRETSHQGKEQLSVDEAFIEISNLNKMTAKLSRLPKSSAKSASQEKNGFKQERANKASQKNNVNDSKISESERSQLNVHNEYNSRLKNDRTSKKHKKSESYQVDYKSLLIDAVKEKNDNVQIFDNYHEETAEIGKSTKDLLKRPTEEINIKNKNPIKEQSENLELKSAPSAVNKKTDEAKNLQKEASEDLEDIKQAKTLAIKELNQVLDEDITKILAWINEPGNKIPTFNKLNSLASAEDSSSFAKPRIFTNIRNEGNGYVLLFISINGLFHQMIDPEVYLKLPEPPQLASAKAINQEESRPGKTEEESLLRRPGQLKEEEGVESVNLEKSMFGGRGVEKVIHMDVYVASVIKVGVDEEAGIGRAEMKIYRSKELGKGQVPAARTLFEAIEVSKREIDVNVFFGNSVKEGSFYIHLMKIPVIDGSFVIVKAFNLAESLNTKTCFIVRDVAEFISFLSKNPSSTKDQKDLREYEGFQRKKEMKNLKERKMYQEDW
ncbi:hypothetical protein BY996DRAFT_8392978 [Phakopsora pachyrhizi]|nr:hypothetical protein BY996DRAFT_8392978 [Phakopsora pachyrhizi]